MAAGFVLAATAASLGYRLVLRRCDTRRGSPGRRLLPARAAGKESAVRGCECLGRCSGRQAAREPGQAPET